MDKFGAKGQLIVTLVAKKTTLVEKRLKTLTAKIVQIHLILMNALSTVVTNICAHLQPTKLDA
jgi:hypothetical protein